MSNFKVGDQVIIMPSCAKGHIINIDRSSTHPIEVNWLHSPSKYEGSYTLEGFRYLSRSLDSRKYYITKEQTTQPAHKTSHYWSIVKANSLFIHLTHIDQGSRIIPISRITGIYDKNVVVVLSANSNNYDLGPIQFDKIANLLFTQQQSNSI